MADFSAAKLHDRIAAVAPIDGVSIGKIGDKTTWKPQFRLEATAQQRADAQAVINAWTADDWDGTATERKRAKLEAILALHTRVDALTRERIYWTSQGDTGRAAAIQTLIDNAQAQIAALRPQS